LSILSIEEAIIKLLRSLSISKKSF
jgi:hypothetical protein